VNDKHKLIAIELSAVAAPVLLFVFVRSGGPASASAAGDQTMPPPPMVQMQKPAALTSDQQRASEWLVQFIVPDDIRSPLDHAATRPAAPVITPAIPASSAGVVEPDAQPTAAVADLSLTSVVGNAEGGMAIINGAIYRVGEQPLEGYTITLIEPRMNHVVLTDAQGKAHTLERTERLRSSPPRGGNPRPAPRQGPPRSAR
jgi:hypothetical protein